MFNTLLGLFSHDIGIDLGTANTLVYVRGKGIVIREPSVVALHRKTKDILAMGRDAKSMLGKTPANILAIRPLREGVISDFDTTAAMLKYFIHQVHRSPTLLPKIPRPRIVIGIPSGVTEVERRAVADVCLQAGAREVFLVEEPMAAAIGAGLPVESPQGSLIVDSGGGTTEIAVASLGGLVTVKSLRLAGDRLDQAVIDYAKAKYNLLLGERTAEEVKMAVGNAYPTEADVRESERPQDARTLRWRSLLSEEMEEDSQESNRAIKPSRSGEEKAVTEMGERSQPAEGLTLKVSKMRGRDLATGLPKTVVVGFSELREALRPTLNLIVEAIKDAVEETPPELVADIIRGGITLAGGTAQLPGLDFLIAQKTGIKTIVAKDPMTCVVRGTAKVLENPRLLRRVRVV